MEASLTCAVCLGVFREPVTLPLCSHNFCKSCVLECGEPHGRSLLLPSYVLDGGALSRPVTAQVTCPLCRKVSAIPGGLSTLPVNTTLAELVRLLCLSPRECAPEAGYSDKEAGGRCPEHPEHKLELFCKNCAVTCCGKCVSCHHQGIFHSVNLLDMVYQEEKLIFFNSLKKLREINERFTKNASEEAKDAKVTLRKNIGVVKAAFDETFKALELKKLQYYEFIKQQQIFETKRQEVRKKAMGHHQSTVEALLKDCESLVDEFEPKRFLQMACSLNKRMTSNLDLMELSASHDKDIVNTDLIHVDLKAVLDAISAVNITACTSNVSQPKCNGIVFKTITKIRKPEQTPDERFCPVQSQELCYLQGQIQKMAIRLLSITEMPEYKHMSFEELRMKYYGNLVVQENNDEALSEGPGQILPNMGDHSSLGTAEATGLCAKIRKSTESSGVSFTFNKNEQEAFVKTESKMEIAQDGQMEPVASVPFMFPTSAAVRAKEPVVCSSKGVTSRAVFDDRDQKKTEVIKQANNTNVFPRFCLGKLDTKDLKKTSNTGKPWKKPKTASFLPTTANAESLTSRTLFKFDNKTDLESKVPDLFYNPFSQQECKAQGNESKSLSEDHATQSNSCEEFYDAKSDAEETEENGRPSTSTG